MNHENDKEEKTLLEKLRNMSRTQGLDNLEKNLTDLQQLVQEEMGVLQKDLSQALMGPTLVQKGTHDLIQQGGKRLRPLCVLLAAHIGSTDRIKAHQLAMAVELIHNATLLHDDVVDVAEKRRGAPALRTLYGNALSIFAGDWLLIEALRRVEQTGIEGLLTMLFSVIEEMIFAESLQLERRGKINPHKSTYFRIIEGKTASLFRFSLFAGAMAGRLSSTDCHLLAEYGGHLGIAFQLIDDLLDFTGDEAHMGKETWIDLHEGKITFPLIIACEQDPTFQTTLEEYIGAREHTNSPRHLDSIILKKVDQLGGLDECRKLARWRVQQAQQCLSSFPDCPAIKALFMIAEQTLHRNM